MKLKVEDNPALVRDSKSKAIINIDETSYNKYKSEKLLQSKVINMSEELNDLKDSVNEIKTLLSQILQRN
jgi:hypothetical protein